jgi:hydrogenase maturation protein HypF
MSGLEPSDHPQEANRPATGVVAAEFRVRGVVQGVGFRPFVYGLAQRCGLKGWVRNSSAGVEIAVEGAAADVESFAAALPLEAPERAFIASLERLPAEPAGASSFVILESAGDPSAYQLVSPDIALCDDCRRELLDPADRRYRYPFINCTNCGPRFTIIESLPYDRERTTMRSFALCDDCRREYRDPTDRRFHAEPIACGVCGPHVELWRRGVRRGADRPGDGSPAGGPSPAGGRSSTGERPSLGDPSPSAELVAERDAALGLAGRLLREGAIVAVKGLGGFHLACDATRGDVVRELKRRKGRPHKPLAVMLSDLDEVARHCAVDAAEAELLSSPEHPIVLLHWPRGDDATRRERGVGRGKSRKTRPRQRTLRTPEAADRGAGRRLHWTPSTRRSPSVSATWASCCPIHLCTCCSCSRRAVRWS